MVAAHNHVWVRPPVTCGMIHGWEDTIWSIEFMAPGLVYEGFLIDLLGRFTMLIHGILCAFKNIQATQGGGVLIMLILLGVIPLLDSLRMDLGKQRFSLW